MMGGRGGGRDGGRGGFVHKSAIVKQLKETMQSGHRTGLPPGLLDYFTPRPQLKPGTEVKKKRKKVPFTGVAAYVHMFAGPQDPEEIKEPSTAPRLFKNPELQLQSRLTTETKTEKCVWPSPRFPACVSALTCPDHNLKAFPCVSVRAGSYV